MTKRQLIYRVMVSLAIVLVFAVLIWMFSLRGTLVLLRLDSYIRLVFIGFGSIGLLLLALAIWRHRPGVSHTSLKRWLMVPIVVLTALGIVLPLGAAAYVSCFPPSAVGDIAPRLVVLDNSANPAVSSIVIIQNTRQPQQLSLWYEENGKRVTLQDQKPSTQHIFTLTDLQPDTEYSYQISGGGVQRFKTPASAAAQLRFAAAGDAHFGAATNRRDMTLRMIEHLANPKNGFDMFFSLGDLVEMGGSNSQWMDAFKALSPLSATVPTGYVSGNHDVMFTGLPRYQYFCAPSGQKSASGSPLYYRLDFGKIHFLVLNIEWSAETITARQSAWLEAQLKSIPAEDWKIVLSHGFFYASGFKYHGWNWWDNPETIAALTPLFEKYQVDMVLSGHNHQLELLQNAGVSYVISGGFGGRFDPEREYISPASLWYASGTDGFADVTINGKEATIAFRNADFQVLHSHTIKKP